MNAMEMRRKEKSFTQEALAKRIGVAPSTYSQYASGARLIPLEKSKLIGSSTGVLCRRNFFAREIHN